ncbi:B-box zinc finger protein [Stigmatella aurantiaca]|uniref:Conserved uncharacterized protein n=1 Tax=Stigmatella aurantiaca (strain DW4/3-1) TaxID=378806 RepID=Q09D67_STIAD|nr:B-box zinc finger protein [Stigmatella aurantiaca]ADO67839.1 conserved uncharacterized protein [Stigmatella aurantiaca DW4/3-1]EAU69681.1 hypothetical protein STIAU_2972 [Stigmatella aurantiaca DW4/3-1]
MSVADVPSGPWAARCATHPEEAATGTCARCGTFLCGLCTRTVLGRVYCGPCAERPEVNFLERFRLGLWGRRDAWAWAAGIACALLVPLTAFLLVRGEFAVGAGCALSAGVGGAFFLGLPWARHALLAAPVVLALGSALRGWGYAAVGFGCLFVSALSIVSSTRNQLFFQREVSEKQLLRLWHVRENNPLARTALSVALGGVFLPVMAPLAILLGGWALSRVNPTSYPPVGRKGQALAAIGVGVTALALWGLLLWPRLGGLLDRLMEG